MLKTEQAAIIQNANNQIANLRSMETQYFQNFFSSFGTQAAIVASFIMCALSQTPGDSSENGVVLAGLYWVSSSIAIVFSVYSVLGSQFCGVYGEGLALRGPAGSLARAVNGLVHEQKQVLVSFCWCLVFANIALIGIYYINMTFIPATICAFINVIGLYLWYRQCLQIYNRFKFTWWKEPDEEDFDGKDDGQDSTDDVQIDDVLNGRAQSLPPPDSDVTIQTPLLNGGTSKSISKQQDRFTKSKLVGSSVASIFSSGQNKFSSGNSSKGDVNNNGETIESSSTSKMGHQGYMTIKETGSLFSSTVWKRRFGVIKDYYLDFYSDQRAYEIKPEKPLNKRPILISEYTIQTEITDSTLSLLAIPVGSDHNRRVWEFRFDTISEMKEWKRVLSLASSTRVT